MRLHTGLPERSTQRSLGCLDRRGLVASVVAFSRGTSAAERRIYGEFIYYAHTEFSGIHDGCSALLLIKFPVRS